METKEVVSKIIARTGILSFGDYMLANGLHTQYYLNFSLLANAPNHLKTLIKHMSRVIKDEGIMEGVTKLVGILNKGAIFVPLLSVEFKKPFGLFERYENDLVIGDLDINDKVLIVDDMISTGRTIERVYRIITNIYKSKISKVVVVVDREEGGVHRLKKLGVSVYPIIRITELVDILYDLGIIAEEEKDIVYSEVKERRRRRR